MVNADCTLIDDAAAAGLSLATYQQTRPRVQRNGFARGYDIAGPCQHVSGDTTTPPAPDAVWIGAGDC